MLEPEDIEKVLDEAAIKFTNENLNRPGEKEHALIRNAMLVGWQIGIHQAIEHMRKNGIQGI